MGELGTKYTNLLERLAIKPIFASPGHLQTKGKLERWFRTVVQMFLGEARIYVTNPPQCTLQEFNQHFRAWVSWYNTTKPHKSLPDQCPPRTIYFANETRFFRPLQSQVNWTKYLGLTYNFKLYIKSHRAAIIVCEKKELPVNYFK